MPPRGQVEIEAIDAAGRRRAERRLDPVDGLYPTTYRRAGEEVRDRIEVGLPGDLPAGAYTVRPRLLVDDRALAVANRGCRSRTAVTVGRFRVEPTAS